MPDARKTTAVPLGDLLDELASAALSVLHHDADADEALIERERLIEKFRPVVKRHLRNRSMTRQPTDPYVAANRRAADAFERDNRQPTDPAHQTNSDWDGIPPDQTANRWHWLRGKTSGGINIPARWDGYVWCLNVSRIPADVIASAYIYRGPCPEPVE